MEYSIVISAFNEADKITTSLTQALNFMRTFSSSFEIVVVDDGSIDKTADIVEEYAYSNLEIVLVRNQHMGKAGGLYTGVQKARGDYIYLADADFSAPINEHKKLSVWLIDQNFDIVIASREGIGAVRIGEPYYRHLVGRAFNWLVQLVALPGIRDSQCGFKLFKAHVAKDLFSMLKVYGPNAEITQKPFFGALEVEVLFLARKKGYSIKEVPVTWTFVKTMRLNFFQNSYKMARDVLKIRINDLKGVYRV